jgi:hypothetical protein
LLCASTARIAVSSICRTFRITRETAPNILAKIVERINEKGVLTRQELFDIFESQHINANMRISTSLYHWSAPSLRDKPTQKTSRHERLNCSHDYERHQVKRPSHISHFHRLRFWKRQQRPYVAISPQVVPSLISYAGYWVGSTGRL